jgi:hypothetical protein
MWQVEDRPADVAVVARVRRERLDMFGRICAAHLAGPAEVRADLACVAAEVVARYSNVRLDMG